MLTKPENSAATLIGTSIKRPDIYQSWLKKKYTEFEDAYWLELDELRLKVRDLGYDMPELRLHEFAFIRDWQNGKVSSTQVHEIFQSMDLERVANVRITRRLSSFMLQCDDVADYVKHVIAGLKAEKGAVELYVKYLNMLRKYFEVLARIDAEQVPITWLEQELPETATGQMRTRIQDMPLNQFIHFMDAFIIGSIQGTYSVGDNIVVFDESHDNGRMIHWVFAPKTYIDILKTLYKVKEALEFEQEKAYIVKLIEGYK